MFRKILLSAVATCLMITPSLFAQTAKSKADNKEADSIQGEPQEARLIKERISFIRSFYPIHGPQITQLEKDLESRVGAQKKYMNRNELLLRRRTTAISAVLPQSEKLSIDQIRALRSKYQEQIYNIREAAPLSLTNAVRLAEDMLSTDARKQGREKIEKFFKKQLHGKSLDPAHLDRLILTPVPMLNVSQSDNIQSTQEKLMGNAADQTSLAKLSKGRPSARDIASAKEAAMKAKRAAKHEGHDHGPLPPAASSRKLTVEQLDAPALDRWEETYQTWCTNYDFTPEQKAVAQSIYESCIKQAKAKQGDTKASDKALDGIFSQMKARIDSVASIEQVERFKAGKKADTKSSENKPKNKS